MISPSDREKEEKILSKPSKKKKGRWTKNDTELTVMALPTTIWYILFCFLPMFGLIIAFKNYKITGGKSFIYNLFHSDWAGFKNFSFLIRSNDLFVILRNTILYNLAFIALGMVFSVGLKPGHLATFVVWVFTHFHVVESVWATLIKRSLCWF